MSDDRRDEGDTIYIGGLHPRTRKQEIEDGFSKYGKIDYIQIITEPNTGESRGFAFVRFTEPIGADEAVKEMHGKEFDGRVIKVEKSKRNKPRSPTPGRYLGSQPVRDRRPGGYSGRPYGGGRYDDRRGGGGYDDRRGGYDRRGGGGGYDDRRGGGYDDRRGGGYDDRRGGYDDRRGGYDDRRGGYDDRRGGGYDDRRGGYDDRRGGYDDRRGGYEDRGGYNESSYTADTRRYSPEPQPRRDDFGERPSSPSYR